MGDVIEFKPVDEETEKHGQGEAICMQCRHVWQAVAPIGTDRFECPECHAHKGIWKYEFIPPVSYACPCGNQLFYIVPEGWFCPGCGVTNS